MFELGNELSKLHDLLKQSDQYGSDDDDAVDGVVRPSAKYGPGDIAANKTEKVIKTDTYEKKQTKDIWDSNEIPDGSVYDISEDSRIQPDYEIAYKQRVTTEDIYLQMGNKNPSTASCEDMVIKIKLPGETLSTIDVNITDSNFLDCRSNKYRLGLHLPHPVDNKSSSAKWDSKESVLILTVTLQREFDMFNL